MDIESDMKKFNDFCLALKVMPYGVIPWWLNKEEKELAYNLFINNFVLVDEFGDYKNVIHAQ